MILQILGFIILIIISIILAFFFLVPFFFGAPYEPSRGRALRNIVKLTSLKKGDKVAELGSGDGSICIALAKSSKSKSIEIHGFEINPFLVWISRRRIKKLGLQNKIKIYHKNFWNSDLSKYNKVVLFQFKTIARKLSKKLNEELKPKSLIISHWWKLPSLKLIKKIGRVYLYKI